MSEHQHEHGPDCGCDEELTFILTDEDGKDHEMILIYTFETDEHPYAVLLEKDNPEAEGIIFRMEEDGEDLSLVSIEDDEEWEKVLAIYNEHVAQEE